MNIKKLMSLLVISTVIGTSSPVFAGYREKLDAAQSDEIETSKVMLRKANKLIRKAQKVIQPNLQVSDVFDLNKSKKYTVKLTGRNDVLFQDKGIAFFNVTKNPDNGWVMDMTLSDCGVETTALIVMSSRAFTPYGLSYFDDLLRVLSRIKNISEEGESDGDTPDWMH